MFRKRLNFFGALAIALGAPATADAATVMFSGTRANVNVINPPGTGRCAPLNTVNIAPGALSSTGTSNLGNFSSTQSHCIPGAPSPATPVQPITAGIFAYDFGGGNTLTGIYSGTATFANGTVTGVENLIVQGGSGLYQGTTGFINSVGRLSFMANPQGPGSVGVFNGTLTGQLDVPGVPEPASWAMMIGGFGAIGGAMRARRQTISTA